MNLRCELPVNGPVDARVIALYPYLVSMTQERRVHIDVAMLALRLVDEQSNFTLSIADLAFAVYSQKICCCTDDVPRSRVLKILEGLLRQRLTMWSCKYILHVIRTEDARTDISTYIQVGGLTPDDTCALCCNSMTDFALNGGSRPRHVQRHYRLPCGHKFHYHEVYCIEGTIRKWFDEHDNCPLCRKIIHQVVS